jgi:hypothetical protein
MSTDLERRPRHQTVLRKAGAGLVLAVAVVIALKIVIGFAIAIFGTVVLIAAVIAILWALKTIVW